MKQWHNQQKQSLAAKTIRMAGLLLVLLVLAGCSNAQGEDPVEEVDLSAVNRQVEAFGRVNVSEEMSVSLDISARVAEVMVKDGQQVTAGQPVLSLDLTDYQHQAAELKSQLAVAQAEMRAQAAALGQETDRLAQDLAFAEEEVAQAQKDLEARMTLYEAGAISQEEVDRYRRETAAVEKQVQDLSLRLNRQSVIQQLNISREKVTALEGSLQRLEERMNQAFLEDHHIVCPYDRGAVVNLKLKAGDRADASQPLLQFINLDTLVVEADVLEEFIREVHLGSKATLVPAADRNRSYEGEVTAIADTAFVINNETVVPVTISLKNPDSFLRPNFNVDVFIEIP